MENDASMDHMHMQDMGSDAAVLLGYYDKSVSMWINIHRVYVYFFTQILIWIYFAYNIYTQMAEKKRNVIKLVPMKNSSGKRRKKKNPEESCQEHFFGPKK